MDQLPDLFVAAFKAGLASPPKHYAGKYRKVKRNCLCNWDGSLSHQWPLEAPWTRRCSLVWIPLATSKGITLLGDTEMPFTFILLKHGNSCCYQSRTVITYGVPKDNSATAWQEYNMVSLYIYRSFRLSSAFRIDQENNRHSSLCALWGKRRQPPSFMPEYTDVLIPVLHCGTIVCKCDLCCYHHQGYCRHGKKYTYAHPWDECLEWICPVCTYYNGMTSLNVI